MKPQRCSGILLHPTSLPSPYGIGDLGPQAYRFVEFLARAGQRIWQVLPLVPTGYGNSPYQSPSTFAGNPLLINLEQFVEEGWLNEEELRDHPPFPAEVVDFDAVSAWKLAMLDHAHRRFEEKSHLRTREAFEFFCTEEAAWLDDYALYMALKERHDQAAWTEWGEALANRQPEALQAARHELRDRIRAIQFVQFNFFRQWDWLHSYCGKNGIKILGDVPIYVAHDSADVWANRDLFLLDKAGLPTVVAGVPPDYFSDTGQLWGNPIFDWDRLKETGYQWWIDRLRANLRIADVIRLDHFRGFEAFWQVPRDHETAEHGAWMPGPGDAIFDAFKEAFGEELPLLAEDLGVITEDVDALRARAGLRGMAVLQFGLGTSPADSSAPPHKYTRDLVAYTGTHDNDTLMGWAKQVAAKEPERWKYVQDYLQADNQPFNWVCIRRLLASVADIVILPLQDVLGLGNEARMNLPGNVGANWAWRFPQDGLDAAAGERLRHLVWLYARGGN